MILLADSGSTNTSWTLFDENSQEGPWETIGLNPFHQKPDAIRSAIVENLLPYLEESPEKVCFYGSGCKSDENREAMEKILSSLFPNANVEVDHDLAGAAHSLCQQSAGIVCILGTGSNSCLFDGQKILENNTSLGYILGDEGSGAVLGTAILRDYLYKRLPDDLHRAFEESFPTDHLDILNKIYIQPLPNRFLAKFSIFIHEHRSHPFVADFLSDQFGQFIERNIAAYDRPDLEAHFLGSIAYFFKDEIRKICKEKDLKTGAFSRDALSGLVRYHRNKLG